MIHLKTVGQIRNHLASGKNPPAFVMSMSAQCPLQVEDVRRRGDLILVKTIHGVEVLVEGDVKVVTASGQI